MTLKPGDRVDLKQLDQDIADWLEKQTPESLRAWLEEHRQKTFTPPQDGAEQGSLLELFWAKAFNIEEDGNRRAVVSLGDALEITAALRARVSMVTADDEHLRAENERLRGEVEELKKTIELISLR